jgi:acetyltransferase
LADGEFVFPADVVSALGNGSTKAGTDKLYKMMHEIRAFSMLRGVRGERPSDVGALSGTLLRLSQLVVDFPEIVEFDINPLTVFEEGRGLVGIDMRLVFR